MKLISLKISNFRQFYGTQKIDFSNDPGQNVTVIHGENGSGKTTILNSFKWGFYGITDFDSENEKLLNERLVDESKEGQQMEMSVEIIFEHDDKKHIAKRSQTFIKQSNLNYESKSEDFTLNHTDANGGHITSQNPKTHIYQILPKNLHSYFFFNGERIEKLARKNSSSDIQIAIKNLMGLQIVDRAYEHLKPVIKTLKKELRDLSTGDLSQVAEDESQKEDSLDECKKNLKLLSNNINQFREELSLVDKKLSDTKASTELQAKRNELEGEISATSTSKDSLIKERRDYISRFGFLAFTEELVNTCESFLDDKRKKGELPFKVKEQFIDDLLAANQCICGRALSEGSQPFNEVLKFKKSTTGKDIEGSFITASGAILPIKQARKDLFDRLRTDQLKRTEMEKKIESMSGKLDEINSKIGKIDSESVQRLEAKRGKLNEDIDSATLEKGALQATKQGLDKDLATLKKRREELSAQNEQVKLAQGRIFIAEETYGLIGSWYTSLGSEVREKLSRKVNDTFKKIIRKDYWAKISNEYTLDIYKKVGEHETVVHEKSTGENQITSLSFIASIVQMAKERGDKNYYFKGGIYPIVMDSAYGPLDPEYREKIAEYIPSMSEQVVLMVSDSHWSGEIENKIRPRMGKEFSLVYHAPGPDVPNERVKKSDRYEYTLINEGFYG